MIKQPYIKDSIETDMTDRLQRPQELRHELFGPWARQGDLIMLYSPRGGSKTRVSTKLSHALAGGYEFLGYKPPHPAKVCYFDGEMGGQNMDAIFSLTESSSEQSFYENHLKLFSYDFFAGDTIPDIANYEDQVVYDKLSEGADLIVIDNLLTCSRMLDSRDDDFKQWERIQPWLVKKRAEGVTVILVHHAGKSGDQLGTSRREVMLDTVVRLSPSKLHKAEESRTSLEWHFTKTRNFYGSDAEPLYLEHYMTPEGKHMWTWDKLKTVKERRFAELFNKFGLDKTRDILGLSRGEGWLLKESMLVRHETTEEDLF